jgi:DNA-binding NtrC family response regulator
VEQSERFDELLGTSPSMQRLFEQLDRLRNSDSRVLLTGESGTGKALTAHVLHRNSQRAERPFVAMNCVAKDADVLAVELFGQAGNEFRPGAFQQADGGTLFLDGVGDLPVAIQSALIDTLQQRTVLPVGASARSAFARSAVDVRVITATHRDLEAALEDGSFNRDLYFLLNVVSLESPPLRSRGSDVLLLAQSFVEQFSARDRKPVRSINEAVAERLLNYSWPGNVRELRNLIERAVTLAKYDQLGLDDLPEKIRNYHGAKLEIDTLDPAQLQPLDDVERHYILHVLQAVQGNKTQAARVLDLDRKTLYRKLDQYRVEGHLGDD